MVSDNYRKIPEADYLYSCDLKWWKYHYEGLKEIFSGELWTQHKNEFYKPDINYVELNARLSGLGLDTVIHGGGNSGYQAINLVYLFGAKEIVLVGFDMKPDADGKKHWFGNHPSGMNASSPYAKWVIRFDQMAIDLKKQGIRVINCTVDTALTCFDQMTLEELFAGDQCSFAA